MHPKRKQRLIIISFLMGGFALIVGLAMFVLSENINLFYTPTQIEAGEVPEGARIRAGGMVKEGSVARSEEDLKVRFVLTDYQGEVTVAYEGILPDLFREGQGIVALGRVDANLVLEADEVLAKHDENYMPPEVAEALEKAGHKPAYNQEAYSEEGYGSKADGQYGGDK
jgi:cytochrome c-type biogenesis protein CcmE